MSQRRSFCSNKNTQLKREIVTFRHDPDEEVDTTWECMKKFIRKCLHHGLPTCLLIKHFYVGLNQASKCLVNASSNESSLKGIANEANEILEASTCLITISGDKMTQSPEKVLLQYKNDENFARNSTLKALALWSQAPIAAVNQIATPSCVYCNNNHAFNNWLFNPDFEIKIKKFVVREHRSAIVGKSDMHVTTLRKTLQKQGHRDEELSAALYKYHSPFRMRSSNFITTSVPLLDLQLSPFGSIFIVLKIKLLFSHPSLCPTK
ncbi:unnamed protein product, partial [Citrullus colocynthis]